MDVSRRRYGNPFLPDTAMARKFMGLYRKRSAIKGKAPPLLARLIKACDGSRQTE
jgi:hypothetical protein